MSAARGKWSSPTGIWSAWAKQRALNCYEWSEVGDKTIPTKISDSAVQALFLAAVDGNPIAFEALELLSEIAKVRDDDAPGYLDTWRACRARGFPERPKRRGQPPWANAVRDREICNEIEALVVKDFVLYGGREPKNALKAAEAATRQVAASRGMTPKAIEKVWERYMSVDYLYKWGSFL